MTDSGKAAERTTLVFQLGMLLRPLNDLAEKSPPPTAAEYLITAARCLPDCDRWAQDVNRFATLGAYRLDHVAHYIVREPHNLLHSLPEMATGSASDADRQERLRTALARCREATLASIDLVPIEWTARLHDARTPFAVYLAIRDALGTAKQRIHFFDRYLDSSCFHVYMRDLSRTLEIKLVTTKGKASFGVTEVLPVARLAAGEFTNFALVECTAADLHDRQLRVDDTVFFLGQSIKDAGTQPTNFSPTDSSANAHGILDSIIARGTVIL